jgi:thiol:disulfide interchange protein DsbA
MMQAFNRLCVFMGSSLLAVALCIAPAMAATPAIALVEDYNYHTLPAPEPVSTGGKIEVLEAFSYGCVHCFEYQASVRDWAMRKPKDVSLVLMPATFNNNFALYARGFFAAQALGVAERLHDQVFEAIWQKGRHAENLASLADLYASLGVDREQFLAAARSVGVEARLSAVTQKSERMLLGATPTFYVDGKYQVLTTAAQSYDDIFARLDALVARARAERTAAGTGGVKAGVRAGIKAGVKAGSKPDPKAAR